MKNAHLKSKTITLVILTSFLLMGAKISDNILKVGDSTPTNNKEIQMGDGRLKWDGSSSKMTFSNDQGGSFKDIGSGGGGSGGINLLDNADFESGSPPTSWTASGGTFVRTTTAANVAFGLAAGAWDSNGASQTLISAVKTIPSGMQGQNGVASCKFKTASGIATHKIQAYDGTNVLGEATISSSTSSYPRSTVNFIFPISGNIQLRIISVNANEPEIFVDDCFLGLAEGFNFAQISQATFVGSISWIGTSLDNCTWTGTNGPSTFANFATDADCLATVAANGLEPATKVPGIRFASLPPGEYAFYAVGSFNKQNNTAGYSSFRFHDGTNAGSGILQIQGQSTADTGGGMLLSRFRYDVAQSNITIQIQSATESTNVVPVISTHATAGRQTTFTIHVYRYPLATEQAFKPDAAAQSWSGYHDTDCSWTTTSSSFVEPTADATCTFTQRSNVNFGTVASQLSGGNKLPGIVFTPNTDAQFLICARPISINAVSGSFNYFQLYDGTNELGVTGHQLSTNTSSYVCGFYNAVNTSPATIRLRMKSDGGNTLTLGVGAAGVPAIEWTVLKVSESLPAPLLVNSVVSGSAGVEAIERVFFGGAVKGTNNCTVSPCTVHSQSGNFTSSVTRSSAGVYVVNFTASKFSTFPTCTCSALNLPSNSDIACSAFGPTTALVNVSTINTAGTLVDTEVSVLCQGPR